MISLKQAQERVDVRLERLQRVQRESDKTAAIEDVALQCLGTDISGPELARELQRETSEAVAVISAGVCDCPGAKPPVLNCASAVSICGFLNRVFWLGYEMGSAQDA